MFNMTEYPGNHEYKRTLPWIKILVLILVGVVHACGAAGAETVLPGTDAATKEAGAIPGAFDPVISPMRPGTVPDEQGVDEAGDNDEAGKRRSAVSRFWSRFVARRSTACKTKVEPMARLKVTLSADGEVVQERSQKRGNASLAKEVALAEKAGRAAGAEHAGGAFGMDVPDGDQSLPAVDTDQAPELDEDAPGTVPLSAAAPGPLAGMDAGASAGGGTADDRKAAGHAAGDAAADTVVQADVPGMQAEVKPGIDSGDQAVVADGKTGRSAAGLTATPTKQNQTAGEVSDDASAFRYRVRPGDSLEISIPYEEGTTRKVPVQPDGYVRYLFDVEVMAAGKTYKEIHDALLAKLRRYYKNPRVTVIGTNFQGNSVFVMGPVGKPGPHIIHHGTRLLDVLASAGVLALLPQSDNLFETGKRREIVDLKGAYIARNDRVLEVDFQKLLIDRDLKNNNILLRPGDFIFIPSTLGSEKKVYICGRVANPQVYYYTGDLTFMEAMLEVGGADTDNNSGVSGSYSDTAHARACYIVRKNAKKPIKVDWPKIQMAKAPDIPLQNGDIIYVPERSLSYGSRVTSRVIGEILAPLKAVLNLDNTTKDYYRHDWEFRK